eukprot:g2493.t1
MKVENPLHRTCKDCDEKRSSLNKHSPPQLRESKVGDLVDNHEKRLLRDTMQALRYEDFNMKHAEGRDFAGPFVMHNAIRDLVAHLLYYTLGPVSLLVLVQWLGKEVCSSKLFLPHPMTRGPYIGSLVMSFTGPLLMFYLISSYLYKVPFRFVNFFDFFIPLFEVFSTMGMVYIKHGLMDGRNYMKRNYSSKSKKMRRMSSVPSEKSFSFHEQGAPLSIYVGMIGNGEIRQKALEREYTWIAKRILHFDQDYLQLPLGFGEQPGVTKKQIVHNESNLKMKVGTNNSQSKVFFTKVKARHLGEAIITSTVCNCNQNNFICESCKKNADAMSFFGRHVDFWSVTYVIARTVMLLFQANFDLKRVLPVEWVILVVTMILSWKGSKPLVAQCGLAYCDFRRRRFFENRLAMMIHQMNIRSHKCVEAWERLRLSFKKMGSTYYRLLQWYNAYLILYFALYFVAFSLLLVLDVSRSIPIYMKIVVASFGFYMQGVMLYGIRAGSVANRVGNHHAQEWLHVKSNLIHRLHETKRQIRHVNRKDNVVDELHNEADPALDTTKNKEDLLEQCESLNSAIIAIDNIAKKLNLELMYGGIRLMSIRLTKRFFKIVILLYVYEIYYFLYAIIAMQYFESEVGDMVQDLS